MSEARGSIGVALFAELFAIDQLARARVGAALPKGMELSHFTVLNHLARVNGERTPAQLARAFSLARSAMTNTLGRLERSGWVHVRPDWEDARRKLVAISPAGRRALEDASRALAPVVEAVIEEAGAEDLRAALPVLRRLRQRLAETDR